jgi:hypothetical protein
MQIALSKERHHVTLLHEKNLREKDVWIFFFYFSFHLIKITGFFPLLSCLVKLFRSYVQKQMKVRKDQLSGKMDWDSLDYLWVGWVDVSPQNLHNITPVWGWGLGF